MSDSVVTSTLFSEMNSRLEQFSVGVVGGQGILIVIKELMFTFSIHDWFVFVHVSINRSFAPPRETAVVLACLAEFQRIFAKFI